MFQTSTKLLTTGENKDATNAKKITPDFSERSMTLSASLLSILEIFLSTAVTMLGIANSTRMRWEPRLIKPSSATNVKQITFSQPSTLVFPGLVIMQTAQKPVLHHSVQTAKADSTW